MGFTPRDIAIVCATETGAPVHAFGVTTPTAAEVCIHHPPSATWEQARRDALCAAVQRVVGPCYRVRLSSETVDPELAAILKRFHDAGDDVVARAEASRDLGLYSERKTAAEVGRPVLYAPADVDWASARWGANCGPTALAAALGCDVMPLKPQFPQFPHRAYTTLTMMREALAGLRRGFSSHPLERVDGTLCSAPSAPRVALVQVQWTGPWTEPGANPRWAYTHTHWIAVTAAPHVVVTMTLPKMHVAGAPPDVVLFQRAGDRGSVEQHRPTWVYDVNADHTTATGDPRLSVLRASGGGWVQASDWLRSIVPLFLREIPRATGFYCRHRIEVIPT